MQLTDSQLKVVNHSYDPRTVLSVQAGPGTGKTLTLVHRVKKLLDDGLNQEEIVVLSLTNRTVKAFRNELASLIGDESESVRIQTFHSFANSLIEDNSEDYLLDRNSQILVNETSFKGYTDLFVDGKKAAPLKFRRAILAVKSGGDLDQVAKRFGINKVELNATIKRFSENGILTYLDFISSAMKLIDLSQGEIIKDIKVLIIDEFQDMQPELVKFIEKLLEYGEKHVTLAGDRNQCIYEFLGSYPEITSDFIKRLKWKEDQIIMRESFRLTPENMNIANSLIHTDTHLVPIKESSADPVITEFSTPNEEYNFIAREISRLILELGGLLKFSDFAILTRSNRDVEDIASFMSTEYGYDVNRFTQGNEWINSKVHIFLDLLDILRKSKGSDMAFMFVLQKLGVKKSFLKKLYQTYENWNEYGIVRFEDYLRSPIAPKLFNTELRKMDKSIIDNFIGILQEERQQLFLDPISIMTSLARITRETKLIEYLNESKSPNQDSVVGLLEDLEGFHKSLKATYKKAPSIEYFLRNYQDEEPRPDDNSINISTVHKAKGLEFPVVFLVKSSMSYTNNDPATRLLYVAMTRAKNLLYCSLPGHSHGMPVEVNPTWLINTARDLKRVTPTINHLSMGHRLLKTIRPI